MSQQKIYSKRKITYKKQNLEHNCVLQESCKTEMLAEIFSTWQGRSLRRRLLQTGLPVENQRGMFYYFSINFRVFL